MRAATTTADTRANCGGGTACSFSCAIVFSAEDFERFKTMLVPKQVAADFLPLLIEGAASLAGGAEAAGGLAAGGAALAEGAEMAGAGALAEMAGGGEAAGGAAEAG